MAYTVKEMFKTLQGEGARSGQTALFCRFAGCNLWSGREEDRTSAVCTFCDTDFVGINGTGGGRFGTAHDLATAMAKAWGDEDKDHRFCVLTGGEPLLQVDDALIEALHEQGFFIAVETNGTLPAPKGLDWICVSPKANAQLKQNTGHEIKLVFPQEKARPEHFEDLQFDHFFLQPMDGSKQEKNTKEAIAYCMKHPKWRLSLQTHKMIGIP